MVNTIAAVTLSLLAAVPAPGNKEIRKPPLAQPESVIVKLLPHAARRADGNYVVEGEQNAEQRYNDMKAALDAKFEHMFELKASLEKEQQQMSAKWEEYYALHDRYNKELKKIIAAWVVDTDYSTEK